MKPRWCSGELSLEVPPAELTLFDVQVEKLGLVDRPLVELFSSPVLRDFAQRYRHTKYVPEILLSAWGLEVYDVDINLCP